MEIRGKIIAVLPLQSGQGRNGEWKRQEYVIEHSFESQYPRKMAFNLWGDRISQYQLQEGQMVKVDFDIDCREYQGRWYNDLRAWRVEIDNAANPVAGAPQQQYQPQPQYQPQQTTTQPAPAPSYSTQDIPPADNEESDLPF